MDVKLLLAVLCVLPLYCECMKFGVMEKGSNGTHVEKYKRSGDVLSEKDAIEGKPRKLAHNQHAVPTKSTIRKRKARNLKSGRRGKKVMKQYRVTSPPEVTVGSMGVLNSATDKTPEKLPNEGFMGILNTVTEKTPENFPNTGILDSTTDRTPEILSNDVIVGIMDSVTENTPGNLSNVTQGKQAKTARRNPRRSRNGSGSTQKPKSKGNRRRRVQKRTRRKSRKLNLRNNATETSKASPKAKRNTDNVQTVPEDIYYHLQYALPQPEQRKGKSERMLDEHVGGSKNGTKRRRTRKNKRKRNPDNGKQDELQRPPRSNSDKQLISVMSEGRVTDEFTQDELMGLLLWLGFLNSDGTNSDGIFTG